MGGVQPGRLGGLILQGGQDLAETLDAGKAFCRTPEALNFGVFYLPIPSRTLIAKHSQPSCDVKVAEPSPVLKVKQKQTLQP